MLTTHDPVRLAWTAFLSLAGPDREPFLHHAGAYLAAMIPTDLTSRSSSTLASDPVLEPALLPGGADGWPRAGAIVSVGDRPSSKSGTAAPLNPGLPLIGGPDLDLEPRTAFCHPAFKRTWRPGLAIEMYIGGCAGLKELKNALQLHAYAVGVEHPERGGNDIDPESAKVGVTRNVTSRMSRLARQGHGSVSKADPRNPQRGFDNWAAEALPTGALDPSPCSPVRVLGDRFELTLPAGTTRPAFDRIIARALSGCTLAGWAMSAAGQAYCAARGVDPATLVRGTPETRGVSWSGEIVFIRPRAGALRLLRLVEDLLIEMVTAGAATEKPVPAKPVRKRP